MVAAAIVGGAIIGGVASSAAANKGANAQKDAANSANATQLNMFNQNRADATPYRETGYQALNQLASGFGLPGYKAGVTNPLSYDDWVKQNGQQPQDIPGQSTADKLKPGAIGILTGVGAGAGNLGEDLFGGASNKKANNINADIEAANQAKYKDYVNNFQAQPAASGPDSTGYFHDFTLADFNKDPGYDFRQAEGQRGVETSAAARGGLLSGGALKGIDQYNQNFASNEYSNAYNRFNNDRTQRFNRLSSLAGLGQTAVTTTGTLGQQTANQISNNQTDVGNVNAARYIGQANAINNTGQTLGNYYLQRQYGGGGNASPSYYGNANNGNYGGGTPSYNGMGNNYDPGFDPSQIGV